MMLLMGIWTSLTKKPTNPIRRKPIPTAWQILRYSATKKKKKSKKSKSEDQEDGDKKKKSKKEKEKDSSKKRKFMS